MSNAFALINSAFATEAGASALATQGSYSSLILMSVFFIAFFYFVMLRPQNKRNLAHKNLINSLVPGDEIITSGGIIGKITHKNELYLILSVTSGTTLIIQYTAVVNILPKGTIDTLLTTQNK